MASRYTENIFSVPFVFWFGLVFVIMFGYALIWQQILKRMPLTVAYANRPVTLIWGIIWGGADLRGEDHLEHDRGSGCDLCRYLAGYGRERNERR